MSAFNALSIALAKANVKVDASAKPTAEIPATRTCVGTTKAGALCRNHPLTGSEFCRLHQPAVTPALAALQSAIAAAKAEAETKAHAKADALRHAKARAEVRREAVARRDDLLRQIINLGEAIADAQAQYDRTAAPLAQALNEARRLGDLVPVDVLNTAQAEADALRKEFNLTLTQHTTDLRRLQAQVRQVEESAAYRAHLDILDALHTKGVQILARANGALNAKNYNRAEALAAKALRSVFPEDIRDRAEKFLDVVRYRQRNAARVAQGKWFSAARAARQSGDVLIAVGKGQFAHLRPVGGSHRRPKKWAVVSALGYDAPAEYNRFPRATRLSWKKKGGA